MGAALSTRRNIACAFGLGMCVAAKHGLVVVTANMSKELHMYSLVSGTLIRTIGSQGNGKGQFRFGSGGLSVSPDGDSVLVAEWANERVQEVRIVDGSWVRFVGIGVLQEPHCVDCNADVIVVSEKPTRYARISVFSWADGCVRAQFNTEGNDLGQLYCGVRLLTDGIGLVAADWHNDRLCVFTVGGEFVAVVGSKEQGLRSPYDVLERVSDGFIITSGSNIRIRMRLDGVIVAVYGKPGIASGEFSKPEAVVPLPNDGCYVLETGNSRMQYGNSRMQYLTDARIRLAWMRACVYNVQHLLY